MTIEFRPGGVIRTPFTKTERMPIQPAAAVGVRGTAEVFAEYRSGLNDLDGFSHIILPYHFHRSHGFPLAVVPFLDVEPRGLIATRAPKRPNAIGLSLVQLDKIDNGGLQIQNVDILDGTPLPDIKPYVPEVDAAADVRTGRVQNATRTLSRQESDDRFT